MKTVRWARPAANKRRILRVQDLVQLGVEHKGEDLTWSKDNKFEIVMTNRMSDSLVGKLPGEFVVFDIEGEAGDEPVEILEPLTTLTPPQSELADASDDQASDESQGSLDLSVSDETTAKRSSKRTSSPDA